MFDVYVPGPYERVWLVDVNPWAPRTDPLLFSWLEILNMPGQEENGVTDEIVRLSLNRNGNGNGNGSNSSDTEEEEDDTTPEALPFTPEFRLINRDDPEAYSFNTPQYSAHKLPRDVVDASADGEAGLREFLGTWREIVERQEREEREERQEEGRYDQWSNDTYGSGFG